MRTRCRLFFMLTTAAALSLNSNSNAADDFSAGGSGIRSELWLREFTLQPNEQPQSDDQQLADAGSEIYLTEREQVDLPDAGATSQSLLAGMPGVNEEEPQVARWIMDKSIIASAETVATQVAAAAPTAWQLSRVWDNSINTTQVLPAGPSLMTVLVAVNALIVVIGVFFGGSAAAGGNTGKGDV